MPEVSSGLIGDYRFTITKHRDTYRGYLQGVYGIVHGASIDLVFGELARIVEARYAAQEQLQTENI